ncbi:MAG: hypothetical protein QE271_08235 [Bacteriovoracaceae bacterium]|nr:hypothetical protein [Bacteriovoracaceae bacterium]
MSMKLSLPKVELRIGGASLSTGKWEDTYFCALHFFPDQKRWAVKSLQTLSQSQDLVPIDPPLSALVVDLPLTHVLCPHGHALNAKSVSEIKQKLNKLLDEDAMFAKTHPKKYEQERKRDELIDFKKNLLEQKTSSAQLSLPFKRKLKKGFAPHLHRPIDAWVWLHYFDAMHLAFGVTFDSFGHVSVPLLQRFSIFREQLGIKTEIAETNYWILLLELYRADIISKKQLLFERKGSEGASFRGHVVEQLESELGLFIYEQDFNILVKNPRAFASFLFAVAGLRRQQADLYQLPKWSLEQSEHFFVPHFLAR